MLIVVCKVSLNTYTRHKIKTYTQGNDSQIPPGRKRKIDKEGGREEGITADPRTRRGRGR